MLKAQPFLSSLPRLLLVGALWSGPVSDSVADQVDSAQARFMTIPGTEATVYLAVPDSRAPRGAIIVSHGRRGFAEDLKELTREFASRGYASLMLSPIQRRHDDLKDLDIAVRYLNERFDEPSLPIGLVGFCGGGYQGLLFAATRPDELDALVVFYSPLEVPEQFQPDTGPRYPSALDAAHRISLPVQGHFGARDHLIDTGDVEKLRQSLSGDASIYLYESAEHGFNDRFHGHYSEQASRLARKRMFEFLERRIGSSD